MPSNEAIAIYASETRLMIYLLWGGLLCVGAGLVAMSILYGLKRVEYDRLERHARTRDGKRKEEILDCRREIANLSKQNAAMAADAKAMQAALAQLRLALEEAQSEARRQTFLYGQSETALKIRNREVDDLRTVNHELISKLPVLIDVASDGPIDLQLP